MTELDPSLHESCTKVIKYLLDRISELEQYPHKQKNGPSIIDYKIEDDILWVTPDGKNWEKIKLHSKSETSKLKIFIQVFDALVEPPDFTVEAHFLVDELSKTGKFLDRNEIMNFIQRAEQNGQIRQVTPGIYERMIDHAST